MSEAMMEKEATEEIGFWHSWKGVVAVVLVLFVVIIVFSYGV
jgi:hypothetical protein